eukprot:489545-Pelagomonas_calceolata.AAC.1
MGAGGTCYTEHTLFHFKQVGLDHKRAVELARKLHAHSVMYADKPVSTKRPIGNNNASYSQVLEPGASNNPPLRTWQAPFSLQLNCPGRQLSCPLSFVQAVRQGTPIPIQEITDDLRHRLRAVWRDVEGVNPRDTY